MHPQTSASFSREQDIPHVALLSLQESHCLHRCKCQATSWRTNSSQIQHTRAATRVACDFLDHAVFSWPRGLAGACSRIGSHASHCAQSTILALGRLFLPQLASNTRRLPLVIATFPHTVLVHRHVSQFLAWGVALHTLHLTRSHADL